MTNHLLGLPAVENAAVPPDRYDALFPYWQSVTSEIKWYITEQKTAYNRIQSVVVFQWRIIKYQGLAQAAES